MVRIQKVKFEGVAQHILSKHLRRQGLKIEAASQDHLFLRTDKDAEAVAALAKQIPGAVIQVSESTKHEARL